MRFRFIPCLRALLLLWLIPLALAPQAAFAQFSSAHASSGPVAGPPNSTPSGSPDNTAVGDARGTAPGKSKAIVRTNVAGTDDAPPAQAKKPGLGSVLTAVGITIAALASIAALVFALLGWRTAKYVQKSMDRASQRATDTLSRLPTDISTTILNETRPLRTLNAELERLPQKISDKIAEMVKNPGSQSQQAPIVTSSGPSGISSDQIRALAQAVTNLLAETLNQVTGSSRIVLDAVQSLRRQLEPQIDPRPSSLSTLLAQATDPSDALVEAGQKLQTTFQKLGSGGRDGDYFLDNLAQTVYVPLSVPLAPLTLTEAQMGYRTSLLGAIERTRIQAATKVRQAGLEIMPVEVSKTTFDGNRHDAMLGTEIRTDRAELSGKVAEVLKYGFLQRSKEGSIKVLRKAQVRLFLQAQPKIAAPPPVAPPPPPVATPEPPIQVPMVLPEPSSAPNDEAAEPETKPEAVPQSAPDPVTITPAPDVEVHAVEEIPAPIGSSAQEQCLVEMSPEPTQDVFTGRERVEAYRGTNSSSVSLPDWKLLAEALTAIHQTEAMDGPALDEMLASVFLGSSPRSIVPQLGEATKPLYESETFVPGWVVAEVLRVGIEIPSDASPNRPVSPLVRLAPK